MASTLAFGETAGIVISILISFALFSSLSAFILLGPRVYYSMAEQGYFFKMFARVNHKTKVPLNAILLQSGVAFILVLSGTFEQILVYMGFSLGIFPILAVLGVFKIRRTKISKLKLPGYPLVHVFFIITGVLMLVLAFLERPFESSIAILTALSGIPVYYYFKFKKNTEN
jgi:APA family basic amino acid/polyamine antiporter